MKKSILFLYVALLGHCFAQTPVSLTPLPGPFLYTNGPNTGGALAFGCVFTYATGTTTPLATYTDSSGLTTNANPVILNSGGYAQLWFQQGSVYSIKVVSSGGINCASGSTQYTVNGVNQSLLNLSNTWQQTQYFVNPIYLEPADLQMIFGVSSGSQTTLDIPPTSANYILHGPPLTGNDTLLSANATQTASNKNLLNPQVNGCGMANSPGTYVCIPNNTSTATLLNGLAVLTGAPSTATIAPTSVVNGVLGVVTAGAGITGTATIQQSGQTNCLFSNPVVAGDYIIPSISSAGYCEDLGIAPPTAIPIGEDVLGVALQSNASGLTSIFLYGGGSTAFPTGTPTVATLSGAGTGALGIVTANSSDHRGLVSVATGSSPAANASVFILNFGYGSYPYMFCTLTPANGAAAIAATDVYAAANPTGMVVYVGATPLAGTYTWNYSCDE